MAKCIACQSAKADYGDYCTKCRPAFVIMPAVYVVLCDRCKSTYTTSEKGTPHACGAPVKT